MNKSVRHSMNSNVDSANKNKLQTVNKNKDKNSGNYFVINLQVDFDSDKKCSVININSWRFFSLSVLTYTKHIILHSMLYSPCGVFS